MKRHYALLIASIVLVAMLALVRGPGVPRPAYATPEETATAAANATGTAAVATQTAAVTRTTGAATQTAVAATTQTAAPTPTPNPQGRANARRVLNEQSRPGSPQLGEVLKALWNARQSGGGLTVATPATTPAATVDIAALLAVVQGVPVSKTAQAAQAITACGNTTATQYKKCVLCVSPGGTYTFRPGTAATTQEAALLPHCAHDETEVAYLELPPFFTANTTVVTPYMLKQRPTLRQTTAIFGER